MSGIARRPLCRLNQHRLLWGRLSDPSYMILRRFHIVVSWGLLTFKYIKLQVVLTSQAEKENTGQVKVAKV